MKFLVLALIWVVATLRNLPPANGADGPLTWVITPARLPHEVSFGSAVYDTVSGLIYIIGGDFDNELVLWYNVRTGALGSDAGRRIPALQASAAFITDQGDIFYLGGVNYKLSANIMRYSTLEGGGAVVVNELPRPMSQMASAFDSTPQSQSLYMFGGYDGRYLDLILEYNLPSNQVRQVGQLPESWNGACAVRIPPGIYIFGGNNGTVNNIEAFDIHAFDPTTKAVTKLPTKLPRSVYNGCAVGVGSNVYILYGITEFGVIRFSPETGVAEEVEIEAEEVDEPLPPFLYGPSCVYVQEMRRIYVVGGKGNFGSIAYIDLTEF